MTLEIANFKEVGRGATFANGGQSYAVFSDTDTLATMMADSYLDGLSSKLNTRDNVKLAGTDGVIMVGITNTNGVITTQAAANTGVALAVTNPTAIAITNRSVDVTSSSATPTPSLADGAIGQLLNITLVVDDGTMTMTPANGLGYSTITFADAGDSVQLEFKSGGWAVIGQGGLSTGPVVA